MAQKPKTPRLGDDDQNWTPRARMAAACLPAVAVRYRDESPKFLAHKAVELADELLKALDD